MINMLIMILHNNKITNDYILKNYFLNSFFNKFLLNNKFSSGFKDKYSKK